ASFRFLFVKEAHWNGKVSKKRKTEVKSEEEGRTERERKEETHGAYQWQRCEGGVGAAADVSAPVRRQWRGQMERARQEVDGGRRRDRKMKKRENYTK
ncbi:hypothetical protein Csa_023918, partial [Cucumis sativus]